WGLFLSGTAVAAAPPVSTKEEKGPGGEPVRLTVELSWERVPRAVVSDRRTGGGGDARVESGFVLELTEGRVVEALAWPPEGRSGRARPSLMGPGPMGTWRLGHQTEGRVRARLEAPLEASLIVRSGDQVVSVPIGAILDRPQHTPPQAPLTLSVE